jgi:hypothetical protein
VGVAGGSFVARARRLIALGAAAPRPPAVAGQKRQFADAEGARCPPLERPRVVQSGGHANGGQRRCHAERRHRRRRLLDADSLRSGAATNGVRTTASAAPGAAPTASGAARAAASTTTSAPWRRGWTPAAASAALCRRRPAATAPAFRSRGPAAAPGHQHGGLLCVADAALAAGDAAIGMVPRGQRASEAQFAAALQEETQDAQLDQNSRQQKFRSVVLCFPKD